MDFIAPDSEHRLACQMAFVLTQNWEGLVLKACQDTFISTDGTMARHLKLKRDYIPGSGDLQIRLQDRMLHVLRTSSY